MATARFIRQIVPQDDWAPQPCCDHPVVAIGDIHGCDDLLDKMLARLMALPDAAQTLVVCLGDMIDKGAGSAAVLQRLSALSCTQDAPFAGLVCLLGNHEQMMLDFLADPVRYGERWLRYGGDATLVSFGIDPGPAPAHRPQIAVWLVTLHNALAASLPRDQIAWLAGLPRVWRHGTLALSHAGAGPAWQLHDQVDGALIRSNRVFRKRPRRDGIWMVHGHMTVDEASIGNGRIVVDTGAWHSGRLTAVRVDAEGARFLSVTRHPNA